MPEAKTEQRREQWKVTATRADLLEEQLNRASLDGQNVEYVFADTNTKECLLITTKLVPRRPHS